MALIKEVCQKCINNAYSSGVYGGGGWNSGDNQHWAGGRVFCPGVLGRQDVQGDPHPECVMALEHIILQQERRSEKPCP